MFWDKVAGLYDFVEGILNGSHQRFFLEAGYKDVAYRLVDGKRPCAIAVIKKNDEEKA